MFHLSANADLLTYSDESTWQSDAGTTHLEDFESYTEGTEIQTLDNLGIGFDTLAGGGHPVTFDYSGPNGERPVNGGSPHGTMELGNFPNGTNETNRWDDFVINILPNYVVTAFGFWNTDGNFNTLTATAFDAEGENLGSIGADMGTFAGFISDVAVARIVLDGNTGDGWNHMDGLQTNAVRVSLPSSLMLLGLGITVLLSRKRIKFTPLNG